MDGFYAPFYKKQCNTKGFIKKCKKIHGNLYDYTKTIYINNKTKVIIICKKHGSFSQIAQQHSSGQGCNKCITSKGEKIITNFLKKYKINFESQKKFNDCIGKRRGWKLPFDFYIPTKNLCIEFDGEQHFKSLKHFGGDKKFKITQENDYTKNKYCKSNNIKLLRISYKKMSNIEQILTKVFRADISKFYVKP